MRALGYYLGFFLLLAALVALGWDGFRLIESGSFELSSLGDLWAKLDRDSLLLLQPAIERHVAVWLWADVVFPLLRLPAPVVLGVPGMLLFWLCRRR